jgi:hypothetical protein
VKSRTQLLVFKEMEFLMADLNNIISDKDVFMIFETVNRNLGEVKGSVFTPPSAHVLKQSDVRLLTANQIARQRYNFNAPLSTDLPSSSKSAIRDMESF